MLGRLLPALTGHGALVDLLARALVPSPPIDTAQGGYIAEGYDAALDALRATGGEGRRAIAALEARYRTQTGIATLKIRHNNVLGFHIEVPARNADRLMAAEFGLHPPPDPGRRGPLQRARSARAGAAGRPRPATTRSPPRPRISRS